MQFQWLVAPTVAADNNPPGQSAETIFRDFEFVLTISKVWKCERPRLSGFCCVDLLGVDVSNFNSSIADGFVTKHNLTSNGANHERLLQNYQPDRRFFDVESVLIKPKNLRSGW